jgi:hypothetical protein
MTGITSDSFLGQFVPRLLSVNMCSVHKLVLVTTTGMYGIQYTAREMKHQNNGCYTNHGESNFSNTTSNIWRNSSVSDTTEATVFIYFVFLFCILY